MSYINCSDFIEDWVKICLPAKSKVISELGDSAFEDQCGRCERVCVYIYIYMFITIFVFPCTDMNKILLIYCLN